MVINKDKVCALFEKDVDFRKREFKNKNKKFTLIYIDGMVDLTNLSRFVIEQIPQIENFKKSIEGGVISFCDYEFANDNQEIVEAVLRGKAALFYKKECALFDMRKTEGRAVMAPTEESSVLSSKDSFVEEAKVNISLLRKKIVSEALKFEQVIVGKQSKTLVCVAFMENIANKNLVKSVKQKLEKLNVDGVFTTAMIEQALSDNLFCPFPQVAISERPDKICKNLLQGRVAVIVDGIPLAFISPGTIGSLMATPEDYSSNFIFSSIVRTLRYFLISIEILLPGGYVALTTFHYEMIPTKLALSIAESKLGVPFPVIFEVLSMLALFEVLVEAGLHMPKSSGQVVSIVGALVVGEAAIGVNLVSPAAVIIVAISVISSFAMPNQSFGNALRIWRIVITILGAVLGLFGVVAGAICLLIQLSALESFGTPYLSPFVDQGVKQIRKALLVVPDKSNEYRPSELKTKNKRRRR